MPPKKTTKKVKKQPVKKAAKQVAKKKKPAAQPKNKEITMVSPVDPSAHFVISSELADDNMIEAEQMGEALPYYIYRFCEGKPACSPENLKAGLCSHRQTTGLSTKGTNEVVRRLNRDKKSGYNIRLNPQYITIERDVVQNKVTGVSVTVFAENLIDGNSAYGSKFEAYMKTGRNGQYENTFAMEKALSKAERNAKRKLIPETLVLKMIEKLIAAKPDAIGYIQPPPPKFNTVTPPPPKATSPEEVKNLIRRGVKAAKSVTVAMEFDKKVQAGKFDVEFKKEIRQLASTRVDQLNKK